MARLPRLCVPGWPHLLVQAGHNHQAVVKDDADRTVFLGFLREAATTHGVAVHAYALLENELRLLGTPASVESLSHMMQAVGRRYGGHFNRRHNRAGSLWEGRFRATVIEPERHLLACMLFVEQGPAPIEMRTLTAPLPWSSALHHVGESVDSLVTDHLLYWALGNTPFERELAYKSIAQHALTTPEVELIGDAVKKGWPLGSSEFLRKLSANTERRLMPLPPGRPRGKQLKKVDPNL